MCRCYFRAKPVTRAPSRAENSEVQECLSTSTGTGMSLLVCFLDSVSYPSILYITLCRYWLSTHPHVQQPQQMTQHYVALP